MTDTKPSDGVGFDPQGNFYLTDVENNAVTRINTTNQTQIVAQDSQLKWPDSYGIGANDGALYVTTSQLHIPRQQRTEPYRLLKLTVPQ